MKKIMTTIFFTAGILVANQAFAQSSSYYWSNTSLSFSNVTPNSVQVQLNLGTNDENRTAVSNRQTIKIQYRPWMCGDDPTTAPYTACPMIYIEPNTSYFNYDSYGNIMPIALINLQPNTKYRVWLGYDNGIRCIQAPCPSDTWQNQLYSFTTQSSYYPAPTNPFPNGEILTQKLYFGVRGTQVAILENFLASQGYMNSYIDTFFGTITHAAVLRFQTDHGMKADGIVGPVTRSVINQIITTNPVYAITTFQ